ncbi:FeoB-associated Cys-rich membrane protein [Aquiflexum balticum]|nr:FeoB-associated Cys-rich membrane protein [Aquiflexum balticum]
MWQEIIVFSLFFLVLGMGTYRMFFKKKPKSSNGCGCEGCG